jgi:hypothetical protein
MSLDDHIWLGDEAHIPIGSAPGRPGYADLVLRMGQHGHLPSMELRHKNVQNSALFLPKRLRNDLRQWFDHLDEQGQP